jgi:hypothetical protein
MERTSHILTEEVILEYSGSRSLKEVNILVLRGLGLTDVRMLTIAPNLVSLSLSHNDLQRIDIPAGALLFLEEINLNKNNLENLSFLAMCPALLRLYASSNHFSDLEPLKDFCPRLTCACLHGNCVDDLNIVLPVLSSLPDLVEAELDGNPCAAIAGYRSTVIATLSQLRRLDCETITDDERAGSKAAADPPAGQEPAGMYWTHSNNPGPPIAPHIGDIDSARPLRRPTTSHQNTYALPPPAPICPPSRARSIDH